MGWASGSSLFDDIIDSINEVDIDEDTRKLLYEKMIPIFEDEDCDTLGECVGKDKAFDFVYNSLYPEEGEEDPYDFKEEEDE